jgi:hypothetical protein
MAYRGTINKNITPFRDATTTGKVKRLAGLIGTLLLIWVLMTYVGPWGKNSTAIRPIMEFIEERDIDAGALYYTDLEEFAEAEIHINHTMDFTPRGP